MPKRKTQIFTEFHPDILQFGETCAGFAKSAPPRLFGPPQHQSPSPMKPGNLSCLLGQGELLKAGKRKGSDPLESKNTKCVCMEPDRMVHVIGPIASASY